MRGGDARVASDGQRMRNGRDRPPRVAFGHGHDVDPSGPGPAKQRGCRRLCPPGRGGSRFRTGRTGSRRGRHGRTRRRRGGERDRGRHDPPSLLRARGRARRGTGGGVCRRQCSHLPAQRGRSRLRRDGNDLHRAGAARRRRLSRPYRRQPRLSVARRPSAPDQRRPFAGGPTGARRGLDRGTGGEKPAAPCHPARARHGAECRARGLAAGIAAPPRRCLCVVLGWPERSGRRRHDRRHRRAPAARRGLCGPDRGGARRRRHRQRLGRGLRDRSGAGAGGRGADDASAAVVPGRAMSLGNTGPVELHEPIGEDGRYELRELLGEGGVGQVYGAWDSVLGRQVAIKMLRPELSRDREFLTRFYGEAQRLANLNHANITTLYEYVKGQRPFMVMELVRGRTLKELLAHRHHLPVRESLAVLAQTLDGLAHAHRLRVIHRDIKPSNLMVTDGGVVKIMDFGIARVHGSQHMTRAGQAFLTPLYASPEQIRGEEADERSDLYGLGVVFYEMLAGRPPFIAKSEYLLERAHLEEPPPSLAMLVPGLDPRIEAAVMQALAKKPEERFASAEEFARAVGARAIRGDAPDILQEFIAEAGRKTADETRLRPLAQPPSIPLAPLSPPPAAAAEPTAAAKPAEATGPVGGGGRRRIALIGGIAAALAALVALFALLQPLDEVRMAIFGAPRTRPTPPPLAAALEVRTTPAGAMLRIDGRAAGAAPLSQKLAPGQHVIAASLPGYQAKTLSVALQPGQNPPVSIALTPLAAALEVRTTPAGAMLRIDGRAAGAAPLSQKLAPGQHVIAASLPGYQAKTLSVALQPGQNPPVSIALTPLAAALEVRTTPAGAMLRIDGRAAGAAPLSQKLAPGQHVIAASLPGYQAKTLSVALQPGQNPPVSIALAALPAPSPPQAKPDLEGVVK